MWYICLTPKTAADVSGDGTLIRRKEIEKELGFSLVESTKGLCDIRNTPQIHVQHWCLYSVLNLTPERVIIVEWTLSYNVSIDKTKHVIFLLRWIGTVKLWICRKYSNETFELFKRNARHHLSIGIIPKGDRGLVDIIINNDHVVSMGGRADDREGTPQRALFQWRIYSYFSLLKWWDFMLLAFSNGQKCNYGLRKWMKKTHSCK